jgi:hypothetical protein
MRLAGGLVVLLMTVILAVTTAKSYATTCWHWSKTPLPPNYSMFSCCQSCWAVVNWDYATKPGDDTCVPGPDGAGFGFASCQSSGSDTTVQTVQSGYTVFAGSYSGSCQCQLCEMTWKSYVTGTINVTNTWTVLSGGLTCMPEK